MELRRWRMRWLEGGAILTETGVEIRDVTVAETG